MKKNFFVVFILLALFFLPSFVFAQYEGTPCEYMNGDESMNPPTQAQWQACQDWLDQQSSGGGNSNNIPAVNYDTASSCSYPPATGKATLKAFIDYLICILQKSVVPLIFALSLTVFLWGIAQYVINTENEDKKNLGKQLMLWGIIGISVMVAVWGLVGILGGTFGFNTSVIPQLPGS